jgi:hypothetical protein
MSLHPNRAHLNGHRVLLRFLLTEAKQRKGLDFEGMAESLPRPHETLAELEALRHRYGAPDATLSAERMALLHGEIPLGVYHFQNHLFADLEKRPEGWWEVLWWYLYRNLGVLQEGPADAPNVISAASRFREPLGPWIDFYRSLFPLEEALGREDELRTKLAETFRFGVLTA